MPSDNESLSEVETGSADRAATAKKKKKICRHFAYQLIANALEMGWEEHEVANLLLLIGSQLEMDNKKMVKCLQASASGTPGVVVQLIDNGFVFTSAQLLSLFVNSNASSNLGRSMSIAMEHNLFNLNDQDTLNTFVNFSENMEDYEFSRFVQSICEGCSSKKKVGKVLYHLLIGRHTIEEAAGIIFDIVTLDFFLDVEGDMQSFYEQLGELRDRVQALLRHSNLINERGDMVASDEDEQGNLKDFVVGDEEVSYESDSDLEKGSGSSGEELLTSEGSDDEEESDVSEGEEDEHSRRKRAKEKERQREKSMKEKLKQKLIKQQSRRSSSSGTRSNASSSGTASIKKRKLVVEESDDDEGEDSDSEDDSKRDVTNRPTQPLPSAESKQKKKLRLGIIESSSDGSGSGSDSDQEKGDKKSHSGSSIADSSSDSGSGSNSDASEESEEDISNSSSSSGSDGEGESEEEEAEEAEADPHMNLNILEDESDEDSLTEQIDDEY